ncbi:response regulator, partial [Escherichia coli]
MIGAGLSTALARQGMSVDWVRTGPDGSEALACGGYTLVLLDLSLPGHSGIDVLKSARRAGIHTPV